jgi:hypothetical protein
MKKILLSALMVSAFFAQDAGAVDGKAVINFLKSNLRSSDPSVGLAAIKTDRYVLLSQSSQRPGGLVLESLDRNKIDQEQTSTIGALNISAEPRLRIFTLAVISRSHQSKIELCIPKDSIDFYVIASKKVAQSKSGKTVESFDLPREVELKSIAGRNVLRLDVDKPSGSGYGFASISSIEVADGSDSAAEQACAKAVEDKLSLR